MVYWSLPHWSPYNFIRGYGGHETPTCKSILHTIFLGQEKNYSLTWAKTIRKLSQQVNFLRKEHKKYLLNPYVLFPFYFSPHHLIHSSTNLVSFNHDQLQCFFLFVLTAMPHPPNMVLRILAIQTLSQTTSTSLRRKNKQLGPSNQQ